LRKTYLPQIEEKSHQHDNLVREVFIKGLLESGWSPDNLEQTELMQILKEEAKQESMNMTLESGSGNAKRLRGNGDDGFGPVQEFDDCVQQDDNQSKPLSKRQKRSNPLLLDYSQVPRNIQIFSEGVHNISAGMTTPPVDSHEANNESSDLREVRNLSEESTSVPILQLDSQPLVIANMDARSISLDGNMQGMRLHFGRLLRD
jgi:hypothetical protein